MTQLLFITINKNLIILLVIVFAGMLLSYAKQKLTLGGALTGGLITFSIYLGAGLTGVGVLAAFFILAVLGTSWKRKLKAVHGIEEKNSGKRSASQVLANGLTGALLGLLAYRFPASAELFCLMLTSSLSAAVADTLSSEMGNIYGRKFYNILTLKKDKRGLDGVVSLEGTLFGIFGSFVIAVIYVTGFGWGVNFWFIILAGFIGNVADSILGSSLERRNLIGNNTVNFLNTAIGALSAFLFFRFYNCC